jgi:hypothetical protein
MQHVRVSGRVDTYFVPEEGKIDAQGPPLLSLERGSGPIP